MNYQEIQRINASATAIPNQVYSAVDPTGKLRYWRGTSAHGLVLIQDPNTKIGGTTVIQVSEQVQIVNSNSVPVNVTPDHELLITGEVSIPDVVTITGDVNISTPVTVTGEVTAEIEGKVTLNNGSLETGGNLDEIKETLNNIQQSTDLLKDGFDKYQNTPLYVSIVENTSTDTALGSVNVSNVGGSSAVNIQDGGNSITVDGTVTITPSGTQDVNITKFGGTAVTIGQQLAASSIPVILPAATITTLTPPAAITGFATSALQTTGNTSLASIDAGIPATLGQTTMTASMPVVISSDQSTIPVSGTITISPSGTQDENIKQVNGATVNVGAGIASTGTLRVSIASDQSSIPVNISGTDQSGTGKPIQALSNYQNGYSIQTQDTSLHEGNTIVQLLGQILIELKINNQYMAELPAILQSSNPVITEPEDWRNELTKILN